MRSRRRPRSQMAAIDQINVTPLLDLTFLLLIVFMLTMPLMEYGTNVKPPEMNSDSLPDEDEVKAVNLTRDGTVEFDGRAVTLDELAVELRRLKAEEPKTALLLRADGEQRYVEVINLMSAIRGCGFDDVTLVTRAEGK
ncbi:MAG: biopolymer transporter ExbD [Victivallaceae bacterium]|nr:biopolymer transporter ExbD [Victivallaceae bacterium]